MGTPYIKALGGMVWWKAVSNTATMGVPGFLGEIGNCGLWSEAEVKQYVDGVSNVLRLLKVLPVTEEIPR